jgi:hypothetical protein
VVAPHHAGGPSYLHRFGCVVGVLRARSSRRLATATATATATAVEGPRRELRKGRRLRLMSLRLMSPAAAAAAAVEAPTELAGGIAISS